MADKRESTTREKWWRELSSRFAGALSVKALWVVIVEFIHHDS
ncbi:hypothetical protein [Streptosporangium nondiastaticum]|nr:hypothetical protein [Streptosporangium nondiastaticum]